MAATQVFELRDEGTARVACAICVGIRPQAP
jgi:hypothetical protein